MTANPPKIDYFPEELAAVKPPDKITVSEWAAANRILGKHSAIKGPFRLDMVPFLVPIMDDCANPDIDEVGCCKSAQIGATDSLVVNVIGYYSDQDPSPLIVALADEDTYQYVNEEKVQVMFLESEKLGRLYDPKRFNKNEIRLPNGGRIDFTTASSIAGLGSKTCRITIGDEIDKPGWRMITSEAGSPSLLRERSESYPAGHKKHIWLSTPTTKHGYITVMMESFDIVYDWHCPCPHCGQKQPLRWSKKYLYGFNDGKYRAADGTLHQFGEVVWEGGREASAEQIINSAGYCCGDCGAIWTTLEKNEAVRNGEMIPRTPETGFERRKFYHINRIVSLFDSGRLEILIQKWVNIFKIDDKAIRRKELQGFVNSTLGDPFEEVLIVVTESKILKARTALKPQVVPEEAVALTAGIDNQKYGFWFVVRAWARDFTSWNIHYGTLASWDDVEKLLFDTQYPVDGHDDLSMKIWRAALDTGGGKKYENMSMTEEAYWWLRANGTGRGCRVWGTKGSSRPLIGMTKINKALDKTPSGKALPGGLTLITLDTDKLKESYHYRLGLAVENEDETMVRGAFLHSETDAEYSSHILAEEKKIKPDGTTYWEQVAKRNDLLDCETLAAIVADPEWPGGGVNLVRSRIRTVRTKLEEDKPARQKKKKRSFVNSWKD